MRKLLSMSFAIVALTGCASMKISEQKSPSPNYQTDLQNLDGLNERLEKEINLVDRKIEQGYELSMNEVKYAIKTIFGGYEQLASLVNDLSIESMSDMIQAATLLRASTDSKIIELSDRAIEFISVLYNHETDEECADAVNNLYQSLLLFKDLTDFEPTNPDVFGAVLP